MQSSEGAAFTYYVSLLKIFIVSWQTMEHEYNSTKIKEGNGVPELVREKEIENINDFTVRQKVHKSSHNRSWHA